MPNFKKSRFFFAAFYCISLLARFFRSSALNESLKHRGYYMAARRYEMSLRVLANEWNIFSTRENISLYYINTNEIPNHFTLIVFRCERRDLLCSHSNGDIFTCEDNMLFSHAKTSSFRAKAHLIFHWCLYNKGQYFLLLRLFIFRQQL